MTVQGVTRRSNRPRGVVDIETALVWTYQDQRADLVYGSPLGGPELFGADSILRVARKAELGVTIDTSPRPEVGALDPDAETLHENVMGLGGPYPFLLIRHARAATRPEDYPGAFASYGPRLDDDGRIARIRDRRGRVVGTLIRRYVFERTAIGRRRLEMGAAELEEARRSYADWWWSLVALADHFTVGAGAGALRSFVVAQPSAPLPLWRGA